ncbi:AsmA family protein [Neisseria arctica]|uniref:AsmA family protein n=1 Tax=Neisseria arctica TaxID=1470200 RepID=UPI00069C9BF6|nr:AsmA family protein [Neisseria arctica]UOO85863.1 AsmA family protein [Neisseria arctica]
MIHFLRSGKFWLKTIIFGALAALLLALGLQVALREIFNPQKIQTELDKFTAGSGRNTRIHAQIGRSWLPRPTVTLHNLSISKPNSQADAVYIKEMKIGLSWKSLFNQTTTIEKWVIKGADIELNRDASGNWSLADLWRRSSTNIHLNRLIVENSRIKLNLPKHHYFISDLRFNGKNLNGSEKIFDFSGTADAGAKGKAVLGGEGRLMQASDGWRIPQLVLKADADIKGRQIQIKSESSLNWQPQNQTLNLQNVRLSADNTALNLHINAQTPQIIWQNNHVSINEFGSVLTAKESGNQWDAAIKLNKISLHPTIVTIAEAGLTGSHKNVYGQTNFTFTGPINWQQSNTIESPRFSFTSIQDNPSAPQPRFISQLDGSFSYKNGNWQTNLQGLFDRQPVTLQAAYQQNSGKITGNLNLGRLNLTPYLQEKQDSTTIYPKFLSHPNTPAIEADISIGSLIIPGIQADNLNAQLYADNQRISLSRLNASLYNGSLEGGISMANTNPPTFHLQQIATNIQIRPLLQDLFGYHRINGNGNAVIDFSASGTTRQNLMENLKGSLQLNISNGALIGFDMRNILRNASTNSKLDGYDADVQTPFSRLTMSADIEQGILRHNNSELISDVLLINSSGSTNLASQTLSETLIIRNAHNRNAKAVPLKINGDVNNPSVTIDYPRLTTGLNSPEQRQQALAEMLKEQWQWLNPRNGNR